MSRNADESLPPIGELGALDPVIFQRQLEAAAHKALSEHGWSLRWGYPVFEGTIVDPEVPEGTMIAVVRIKTLDKRFGPFVHNEGCVRAYVKNGEVPPFPPEADVIRANDHQGDDDVVLYVAQRDYNKLGNPIVWVEVEENKPKPKNTLGGSSKKLRGRPKKK